MKIQKRNKIATIFAFIATVAIAGFFTPVDSQGKPTSTGSKTSCDSEGGICDTSGGFKAYSSSGSSPLKASAAQCGTYYDTNESCGGSIAVTADIDPKQ